MGELESLRAEVVRLRGLLEMPQEGNTHQCRRCLFKYTPTGADEDCPKCGSNGALPPQGQAGQGEP